MEHLLALADDQTVAGELLAAEGRVDGIHLLVPHGDAALLHQPPGLALAGAQAAPDQQIQHVDLAAAQIVAGELGGGHILSVGAAAKQCPGSLTGLFGLLLAVNQLRQLIGQDILGLVELCALPLGHLIDLLQGQERQHPDALEHVGVAHIAPVLIEFEGAGLVGIQPHGVAGGLTREGLLTARLNGKQVGRKKGVGFETKKAREAKQIIDINQTMSPEHICKALSPEFESLVIRHNLYRKAVASDLITPKIYDGCIEDSYDTAYGLSEIISKGYRLGPTQAAILTDAIKSRVDCRETSLRIFPSILEELENSSLASARTLANRLRPLLRNNVFECQKTGSTSLPLSPNIHVFDLSGYPAGIRIILAELLLYDWFRSARALQTPIIIMVDEVQNLKLGRGTVLNQIITEGRRFSIGSTLISQSLKAFSPDEQLALSQTGTKLFFKPPLTELRACSEMLAPPQHRAETAELLKTLKAGQCLLLSEYVYIGDETHPCTDCIQVNVDLPQSVK